MPTAQFDPDRIARYEVGGWRAYYDRRWAALLGMTITLCQEQFRIPFPLSLKAAYHIVRASVAWVPIEHDTARVEAELAAFYTLALRHAPLVFNPRRVAAAELRYWAANRDLSGRRDDPALVESLTTLHVALFGLSPGEARESAEWRARALIALDRITGATTTDAEADWRECKETLRRCYRAIGEGLTARQDAAPTSTPARANDYHFVTHWRVAATPDEVLAVLGDAPALARWWPSVYLGVEQIRAGGEDGTGAEIELHTRGWLPYTMRWGFRVTEADLPRGFTIRAHGDFDGEGTWTIAPDGAQTDITYDWRIRGDKPLFRYLSFLLKPFFSANHRWAMRQGETSLRLELARRRATSAAERAAIPAPPGPTSATPFLIAGLALGGVAALLLARREHD